MLEAIEMVREFAVHPHDELGQHYVFDELCSRRAGPSHPIEVSLAIGVDDSDKEYVKELWESVSTGVASRPTSLERIAAAIGASTNERPSVATDELRATAILRPQDPTLTSSTFEFAPARAGRNRGDLVDQYVRSIHRMALDVAAIAGPSHLPDTIPRVRGDGGGLATVLNWLLGERDERFDEIENQLREFIPEIRRIRTRRVQIRAMESANVKVGVDDEGRDLFSKRPFQREELGHQVLIDYEHAEGVPASHASEGTLLLLGILTTVHTNNASVLLIDDIERGLHPKTQQQIVSYLNKIAEGGTQVIATSHSPYLLLHLGYEQVRAMTFAGAEGSKIGKLSEHPEFEQWKQEMSPSEFWTVFGESWLQERRADG